MRAGLAGGGRHGRTHPSTKPLPRGSALHPNSQRLYLPRRPSRSSWPPAAVRVKHVLKSHVHYKCTTEAFQIWFPKLFPVIKCPLIELPGAHFSLLPAVTACLDAGNMQNRKRVRGGASRWRGGSTAVETTCRFIRLTLLSSPAQGAGRDQTKAVVPQLLTGVGLCERPVSF